MPEPVPYEILKETVLFRDMSDEELDIVSKKAFLKDYKKGATLFVEGMPGEVLYIIIEGSVDICKKGKEGEVCIASARRGEIVGEMSLIDSEPRAATGRTGSDSRMIVITKNSFNDMLESDPKIAAKILKALIRIISRRLRVTDKKFEE